MESESWFRLSLNQAKKLLLTPKILVMSAEPNNLNNNHKTLEFHKMSGAGNDFIIFDQRGGSNVLSNNQIIKFANRKNIGCDQLILIKKCREGFDCEMQIYNSDGSESSTCGNATRCVAGIIFEENPQKNKIIIKTSASLLECTKISEKLIKVNLAQPKIINSNIHIEGFDFIHVDVGNPHAVSFVDNIPHDNIFFSVAPKIEGNLNIFPNRTNVEFAKIINDSLIEVRVFERGV
ncbi:MAG: diaminopimelate epimerase, partial [Alphaproteobacteria bacterium]|nr:diaminopimelate epimerase [Alphaproteobacteria bacterium]